MLLFLIHLALGFEKNKDSILVCFSANTPQKLLDLFSDFTQNLNTSSETVAHEVLIIETIYLIIDITKDSSLYPVLDQLSQQLNTFYISITPPSGQTTSSLRFHLHPGENQAVNAIFKLVKYLQWQEFSLFGSNQINDQLLAFGIRTKLNDGLKSFFVYEDSLTDVKSDEIVKKLIKTKGVKNLLVIDDGESLSSFQRALKLRKVPKFGVYLVFSNRGIYTIDIEGALILSEPGTENSTSEETFEFLTISNFLDSLDFISIVNLKSKCPNQICFTKFNLVNIQQGSRKIIGTVENNIDLNEQPVFPENNTSIFSETKKSKLVLSIANGTSEAYNLRYIPTFAYLYQGARYAVSRSNLFQEFENFEFDLFPTDCGNVIYDETWFKMCLEQVVNKLGIAYLTTIPSQGAKGNLLTLRSFSKQIPQISPLAILKELESKSAYPELLKLGVEEEFYFLSGVRLLQNLRWKDIIFFVSDSALYLGLLKTIPLYLEKLKIRIINPDNLRVFPSNYTRDQFEEYKAYFQYVKKSRCRVFYIFSSVTSYIIEGLYDIGLRKGDIILIGESSLISILEEDIDIKYIRKRSELIVGSLIVGYKEWEGKLGEQLKNELLKFFNDVSYMCLTYDTVSVVKNAIMHLINYGEDFEDPSTLIETMRIQKFVGCMGNIYFKSDKNYRVSYLISYKQIVYNQTTEEYTYQEFSTINLFSTKLFNYVSEPNWPTGGKSTPSNYIEYSNCGFDDRLVIKSKKAQQMIFIFSSVLLTLCIAFSVLSQRYFKNNYRELQENQVMNLNDYIFILFFVSEFFELASLGPKNGIFSFALNRTELIAALDLANYFDFNFERFWTLYIIVLIVTYTYIILTLLFLVLSQDFIQKNYVLSKLQDLSNVILPLIGHIGFLPLISMLMNIFICEEGLGKDLEESYLERDCTQFCYSGKHRSFVVAGIIATSGFIIISCFLRPYWESIQVSLNLSTKAWYLSVLSVFQALCVFCRKSLKVYSEAAPGFIISILIGILILITFVKKPYNYSRIVVYQITSLVMSLWVLSLSSLFVITSGISIMVPLLFIGLFIILCLGLLFSMKHPKLFKLDESNPIPGLIRFQFTGNIEYLKTVNNSKIEKNKDDKDQDNSKGLD